MDRLRIERHGGFTGLPARGEVDVASLSIADKKVVEELFRKVGQFDPSPGADRYQFRITRVAPSGTKTIVVPEHLLPARLIGAVKEALP
jgi:hypothetical protein